MVCIPRLWLRVFLQLCLGFWLAGNAHAQSPCSSGANCNPTSAHPVDYCFTGSGPNQINFARGTAIPVVLSAGCDLYAALHTDVNFSTSYNSCNPILPDPNLINFGGVDGTYYANATFTTVRRTDGKVVGTVSGPWGFATCGCYDNLNGSHVGLGNDGACYCRNGLSWDETIRACVAVEEINDAQKPQTCAAKQAVGNPIYPLTGAKREFVSTGITIGGLELALTYDSTSKLPANQALATELAGPNAFGPLWKSNLHHKLFVSLSRKTAMLTRGDGEVLNFSGNGGGTFTAQSDQANKLLSIPGGYLFVDTSSGDEETFDSAGNLVQINTASGMVLTFSYADGNLTQVQSSDGHALLLEYSKNLISRILTFDGAVLTPAYDTNLNLVSLTWQDGKSRQFLYEDTAHPWALTGQIDENNSRYATFTYDSQGRAIGSEHAGGVDKFSVSYDSPPLRIVTETFDPATNTLSRTHGWQLPTGVTITQPNGQSIGIDSIQVAGMPAVAARSQPAGSGCAASSSALNYDASGNILSQDDFQGTRTCYAYDSSNRETVRVEGLANTASCASVLPAGAALPTGARKITTSWHPDWRKPTTVTEPLRKTTTVYHGQSDPFNGNATASCALTGPRPDGKPLPLICKRVEQALLASGALDTSAPSRVTTHTYDSLGHMLSSVDPNGKTTTFSYYTDTTFSPFDPNFQNVALLLHGNDASIVDSSPNNLSPATQSGVGITTADKKFGASALSASPGAKLTYASPAFLLTGDVTIEGFFKIPVGNQSVTFFNISTTEGPGRIVVYTSSTGTLRYNRYGVNEITINSSATLVPVGTWFHLAFVRSGSTITYYVNGTSAGTTSDGGTLGNGTGGIGIATGAPNGILIDEIRVTKGLARYTANFIPPTQELGNTATGPGLASTGHTLGDLQSVTNAAGQITRYTQYDAVGRLRQMIDPKGIVTDISYTPRGFVSSVATTPPGLTARTTSYSYDAAGQLTQVGQPGGTTLSYSYDAAHRLIGITDARGNAVAYTLDPAGNRIGEEIRDPAGTLQRTIDRSFDALNRLQQVTGAPQ